VAIVWRVDVSLVPVSLLSLRAALRTGPRFDISGKSLSVGPSSLAWTGGGRGADQAGSVGAFCGCSMAQEDRVYLPIRWPPASQLIPQRRRIDDGGASRYDFGSDLVLSVHT
jgi:hypothetical protein